MKQTLNIPDSMRPLVTFEWSQLSKTYVKDNDIQPNPRVSFQFESGLPGDGERVTLDVKDVPMGSSGFLPNTNRVHMHVWSETYSDGRQEGGYCTYNGDNYKIIRKMDGQQLDESLDYEPYTVEQMVREFTTEVRNYLQHGNYRYDAVYDAVAHSFADLRSLHEDDIKDIVIEEYHREDVDGVCATFNAYGEPQTIYGEFVHELHKVPYVRARYNGVSHVIHCLTGDAPDALDQDLSTGLSKFLSNELETKVGALCGKHITGDLDQNAPEL